MFCWFLRFTLPIKSIRQTDAKKKEDEFKEEKELTEDKAILLTSFIVM